MAADDVVELNVGDQHLVQLPGLGTAGYRWQAEHIDDVGVADVHAAGVREAGAAVGASADELFEIRALGPGSTMVRFVQRRPWEKEGRPANEYVVELHVRS